ncbi:hypothetical protein Salat_1774600 [Sesamum alatum]|uniref:Disease resistance R13L4/SHOC-2-like LRR domain-containing protein n=1 Tax=Sesamum alatum TaxID=300844 RepID=A0AAE1Y9S3_9LAMI|nr:hypothetical protein Salat_1774600 [Sesamum alatum]
MRSFFQDFEKDDEADINRVTKCKMHDMVHDFVQLLTENECLIVKRVGGSETISAQNARHLNILQVEGTKDDPSGPFSIWQTEKLHSCFLNGNEIPLNLFTHLKRVRTLSSYDCQLEHIPEEIGMLSQLRYLNLGFNQIKDLPGTIYDLYYLQTFNIEYCEYLCGLPAQGIHKLINLRHLLNLQTSSEFRFPDGFEKLTNLRTLGIFRVHQGNNNKLEWFKDLNQLSGALCIQIRGNVDELQATKADLKSKKFIKELKLSAVDARIQVIEALQPHPNLQILHLCCRHSPTWIITLTQLRKLALDGGDEIPIIADTDLPPIRKLPLLEELRLSSWGLKRVGFDFLGISNTTTTSIFPKLKELRFSRCRFWEEWEDISEEQQNNTNISIFPCLEKLILYGCHKLKALPHRLLHKASSLQRVRIESCGLLNSHYNPETGQDWIHLQYIPHVEFE